MAMSAAVSFWDKDPQGELLNFKIVVGCNDMFPQLMSLLGYITQNCTCGSFQVHLAYAHDLLRFCQNLVSLLLLL